VPSKRATLFTAAVPAVANLPPATRLPSGATASAATKSGCAEVPMPPAIADQVVPFHRAMRPALTQPNELPIEAKSPPAITSPFGIVASARTRFVWPICVRPAAVRRPT
jgi:hypothetical protein